MLQTEGGPFLFSMRIIQWRDEIPWEFRNVTHHSPPDSTCRLSPVQVICHAAFIVNEHGMNTKRSSINGKTMNRKKYNALSALLFLMALVKPACAQLVVNGTDLNKNKNLEYIQLMYYIDKSSIKPVFYVDYGFIEPEYNDILQPGQQHEQQHITIDGETLTDRVTVVWVLNKMHQAGWEYMGDVVFVPLKVMNNWHIYTLRRREL